MMLPKMSVPLSEIKTANNEDDDDLKMSASALVSLPGDLMSRKRPVHLSDNSVYIGSLPESAEPPEAVFVLDNAKVSRSGRTVTLTPGHSSPVTMKFDGEVEAMNWLRALERAVSSHETLQTHADAAMKAMAEEFSPRNANSPRNSPRSKRGVSPNNARFPSLKSPMNAPSDQERAQLEERLAAMTQKESQANMVAKQADEQLKKLRDQLAKAEAHGKVLQEKENEARSAAKTTDKELQKLRDQFEASEAQRSLLNEKTEKQMMTLRNQLSSGRKEFQEMESKAAMTAKQSDEQMATLRTQLALAEKERQCLQEQEGTRPRNIQNREVQVATLRQQLSAQESKASERVVALENDKASSPQARKAAEEHLAAVRKELDTLKTPPPTPRSPRSPREPKGSRTRSMSPRRLMEIASDPITEIPDSWNNSTTVGKLTVVTSALALGAVLVQASRGR